MKRLITILMICLIPLLSFAQDKDEGFKRGVSSGGLSAGANETITGNWDFTGDISFVNVTIVALTVTGTASVESDLTINPTAVEGEEPRFIMNFDADSDGTLTSESLIISIKSASNPAGSLVEFATIVGGGFKFSGINNTIITAVTTTNSAFAGQNSNADGAGILSIGFSGTSRAGTLFGTNIANWGSVVTTTDGNGLKIGAMNNSPVVFGTNDIERMRITAAGAISQQTYVIRKHVALSDATDNNATNMFTITTTNEAGSADGGAYSVTVHLMASEATAASGAVNTASVSLVAHWTRIMASAGTGANSAIVEMSETADATEGSVAIATVTLTVTETSEFVQQVLLLVDTSGGTFDGFALVELVYSDFTTAPVIN